MEWNELTRTEKARVLVLIFALPVLLIALAAISWAQGVAW